MTETRSGRSFPRRSVRTFGDTPRDMDGTSEGMSVVWWADSIVGEDLAARPDDASGCSVLTIASGSHAQKADPGGEYRRGHGSGSVVGERLDASALGSRSTQSPLTLCALAGTTAVECLSHQATFGDRGTGHRAGRADPLQVPLRHRRQLAISHEHRPTQTPPSSHLQGLARGDPERQAATARGRGSGRRGSVTARSPQSATPRLAISGPPERRAQGRSGAPSRSGTFWEPGQPPRSRPHPFNIPVCIC